MDKQANMKLSHAFSVVSRHFATGTHCLVVAAIATATLPFSTNAVAVDGETTAEVLDMFSGCTITLGTAKNPAEVQGTCLGHTFSNSAEGLPPRPWEPKCYAARSGPNYWVVYNCNIDGRPATQIMFDAKTKRQRAVTWITFIDTAGHIFTRQEVEREQQLGAGEQEAQSIQCKSSKSGPITGDPKPASIYGLLIGDAVPCLNKCSEEANAGSNPMCRRSAPTLTSWGTQSIGVYLNVNVFDQWDILQTGNPVLEILNGKIVGMRFSDGLGNPQTLISMLSSKFGNYHQSDGAYSWETPVANVELIVKSKTRYLPAGQVDIEHPLGEGIASESYDDATFTIYTPAIWQQVLSQRRDERAQAQKAKKPGF
jgi:hypothetical protein